MAEAKPTKEAKRTVSIKLPLVKDDPQVFVGLNGKSWLIKRGEWVDVPEEVAAIIEEAEEQHERSVKFAMQKEQELFEAEAHPNRR